MSATKVVTKEATIIVTMEEVDSLITERLLAYHKHLEDGGRLMSDCAEAVGEEVIDKEIKSDEAQGAQEPAAE